MRGCRKARDAEALRLLHHAGAYLAAQWDADWPRELVAANLEARSLLFRLANAILDEHGLEITRADVERRLKCESR